MGSSRQLSMRKRQLKKARHKRVIEAQHALDQLASLDLPTKVRRANPPPTTTWRERMVLDREEDKSN